MTGLGASLERIRRDLAILLLAGFAVIGSAEALLLPPFYVPDERRHWLSWQLRWEGLVGGEDRACSLEVGLDHHFRDYVHFHPDRKLPARIFSQVKGLESRCTDRLEYTMGHALSYPGLVLGRLWSGTARSGEQALTAFFAARLLQGLLVGALLLRLLWLARGSGAGGPPGLLLVLLLPLSPLFLQQAFGVSNDGLVLAFAASLVAAMAFPDRLNRLDLAGFLALGLLSSTTKPVLAPVVLPALALGLWLDARRLGTAPGLWPGLRSGLARHRALGVAGAVITLVGVAYTIALREIDWPPARAQLTHSLEHPGTVLGLVAARLGELFSSPRSWVEPLGYLDTWLGGSTLGALVVLALGVGALEAAGFAARAPRLAGSARRSDLVPLAVLVGGLVASLVLAAALIAFRLYLMATPLGADRLYGMQGRYFLSHALVLGGAAMALARVPDGARGAAPRALRLLELGVVACVVLLLVQLGAGLAVDLLGRYG